MQKQKIKQYVQAIRMIKQGKTQIEACHIAQISRMTFNKYREQFGEEIAPNLLEVQTKNASVPVVEATPAPENQRAEVGHMSDLERLQLENAALVEQLRLRQELAKFMH